VKNYGIGAPIAHRRKEQAEYMSTAVELQGSQRTFEPPTAKTDEAVWQAWVGKSRARERRNRIGAVVMMMLQAFHAKRYVVAALFGALALLYNPVAPAFGFVGEWQRVVVAASSIPFISLLVWRDARTT
jgi:hypothetical protein